MAKAPTQRISGIIEAAVARAIAGVRVPKFVIAMTGGIDTKKKIVARYGANATFEKGRPLPKTAR